MLAVVQHLLVVDTDRLHAMLQIFDGQDGRKKYPRRWVIFPLII